MSLIIDIAPELEGEIRQAAALEGLSPNLYVIESVTERLRQPKQVENKPISGPESDLLQKVNQCMAHINWEQYRELIDKRQAETLTTLEYDELVTLGDKIEEANVERIELLMELADLRHTTLPAIMKELGIKPISHD